MIGAAIVVIIAVAFVGVRVLRNDSTLDRAIGRLEESSNFATSDRAGETIAEISATLRRDGSTCRDNDKPDARCRAILSASAYTAVVAYTVTDCTAPGVFEGRARSLTLLRSLRTFLSRGATGRAPAIPEVPTC